MCFVQALLTEKQNPLILFSLLPLWRDYYRYFQPYLRLSQGPKAIHCYSKLVLLQMEWNDLKFSAHIQHLLFVPIDPNLIFRSL